jgi:hypothetical protein
MFLSWPLRCAQALHHAALELLLHVDDELLDRLAQDAVDFLDDDFRARNGEFVAFAAHRSRSAPTGAARRGRTP